MDEKQLLRSCLQGEVEEYRKIVDQYRGKIMALALNILGNREDAEDICQDTFIKAYHNLGKFDLKRSFKDWLYTILYNSCRDLLRKKRRFYRFFNRIKMEPSQPFVTQAQNPFNTRKIKQSLLKTLSPKEKAAVVLWAGEGYTSEEISSVLRCSSSTARVHLFKARKKIKALMEKEDVSLSDY